MNERAHRATPDRRRRAEFDVRMFSDARPTAFRDLGMTVAIESPLPHLIGGVPDEFAQLLVAAGADAHVCLDTGHTALGRHWDAFADLAGDRVVHVHAHDNDGTFDDHKPPGDGRIDWARVSARLRATYDGWVMLELACPTEPLREYFARSERQLRALLGDKSAGDAELLRSIANTLKHDLA